MKQQYEKPQIIVDEFKTVDIITTSTGSNNDPDLDIGGGI